jgi:hypothetical protein
MKLALTAEFTGTVTRAELARVAAAIQVQVSRDFRPIWGVDATVRAFHNLEQVPLEYWPIILTSRELDEDGFHISPRGASFSVVEVLPDWSIVASHIVLELLANPRGTRTIPGVDPRRNFAPIEYLVEVATPCQSPACGYLVNDVMVSDFVTPSFYSRARPTSDREPAPYSAAGHIAAPFSLAPGGSLTFLDRPDRRVGHITKDESGQQRLWTFFLRDAVDDPVRPWLASLIGQRKKAIRLNRVTAPRSTERMVRQ